MGFGGWAKLCLFFAFASCGQISQQTAWGELVTTISPITINQEAETQNFIPSSFSANVLISDSGTDLLLDYDFFPIGTDFCSQPSFDAEKNPHGCKMAPMISIPCEYLTVHADDWLNIDQARTVETSCQESTAIATDGASFNFQGMLVSSTTEVSYFMDEFEFKITANGFFDSSDGTPLLIDQGKDTLEGVYSALISKRLSELDQD